MQTDLFSLGAADETFVEDRLEALRAIVHGCVACPLASQSGGGLLGRGSPQPKVLFVGEAPSSLEDDDREPYGGELGEALDWLATQADLNPDEWFASYKVCCRPPYNRVPRPEELKTCERHFNELVEILAPRVIVALGETAGKSLLRTRQSLQSLRGCWHQFDGRPVRVSYPLSRILSQRGARGNAVVDMRAVHSRIELNSE